MYIYSYDKAFEEFQHFDVLNKFQLSHDAIAISKTVFINGNDIMPSQEILHLKYQAVCFNMYSSMYMYIKYLENISTSLNLIYLQASNNYLQSSWDCIYQMISMFNLEDEHIKVLLNDEEERVKHEKRFNLFKYSSQNISSSDDIKKLDKIYNHVMKSIREINNYVKHNGHISPPRGEKVFKGFRVDIDTGEQEFIEQDLHLERLVDVETLGRNIKKCIIIVLDFIETYMESHIDNIYRYLIGFSKQLIKDK